MVPLLRGKSDIKTVAVKDNEVLSSKETIDRASTRRTFPCAHAPLTTCVVCPSPLGSPISYQCPCQCEPPLAVSRYPRQGRKPATKNSNATQANTAFRQETEWDVTNPDPQYHYDMILAAMKEPTRTDLVSALSGPGCRDGSLWVLGPLPAA